MDLITIFQIFWINLVWANFVRLRGLTSHTCGSLWFIFSLLAFVKVKWGVSPTYIWLLTCYVDNHVMVTSYKKSNPHFYFFIMILSPFERLLLKFWPLRVTSLSLSCVMLGKDILLMACWFWMDISTIRVRFSWFLGWSK